MKPTLLFLALLCGAQGQTATSKMPDEIGGPVVVPSYSILGTINLSDPVFSAVTLDELLSQSPAWRAEAADVVKAMKLLLFYVDGGAIKVQDSVFRTEAGWAQLRADALLQKEKDIAWARTILAKWEGRAK